MTNDAKTMLYHLYQEYLVRRDNHLPKTKAKDFGSSDTIQKSLFPDWCLEDVDDTLRELHRCGFVLNHYASNSIYHCTLTDDAICTMEKQKKETILNVLDFVSKFIP